MIGFPPLPEPTPHARTRPAGGEEVLALVLTVITLLVFAGCPAQTAVAAVAAGAVVAAELKPRLS